MDFGMLYQPSILGWFFSSWYTNLLICYWVWFARILFRILLNKGHIYQWWGWNDISHRPHVVTVRDRSWAIWPCTSGLPVLEPDTQYLNTLRRKLWEEEKLKGPAKPEALIWGSLKSLLERKPLTPTSLKAQYLMTVKHQLDEAGYFSLDFLPSKRARNSFWVRKKVMWRRACLQASHPEAALSKSCIFS